MNAYELADELLRDNTQLTVKAANMLRQQADRIAELEKQSEPVGRYYWESVADGIEMAIPSATTPHYMKDDFPLYLAPQTKPLSDEEIYACFHQYFVLGEPKPTHYELDEEDLIDFARAIEERHGIK